MKYTIEKKVYATVFVEVEADSFKDAKEKASNMPIDYDHDEIEIENCLVYYGYCDENDEEMFFE